MQGFKLVGKDASLGTGTSSIERNLRGAS
jgi:hypothetical protein